MLLWRKTCKTTREFMYQGFMVSSGYHIVTGMALFFWSAISQPSPVSFVRTCKYIDDVIDSNPFSIVALHPLRIRFCSRTFSTALSSATCLICLYLFHLKLSHCIHPFLSTVLFLNPPNFVSSPHSIPTHSLPSPIIHVPQRSP